MKRLLLVTYCWPPDPSVGSLRPAKLARSLSQQDWQPIVITAGARYRARHSGADEDSGAIVVRTRALVNPAAWYRAIKAGLYALLGRSRELTESRLSWAPEKASAAARESILARLRRTLLSLLHTPDDCLGWLPFAILASLRAAWGHRFDGLVSTGPPFTAHLAARVVKAIYALPWVADFRDPWASSEQKVTRSRLADALDRWMESTVMRHADRVVCVTPAMTEAYRRRYPELPPAKWVTITNGFDAEDFRGLAEVPRASKFTISYVGNFFYARSPESLLQAIGEMLRDGRLDRQDLAVRFIGACRYAGGRPVAEMIAARGLDGLAEILDTIPRPQALREMIRSHVLVLLANEQRLQVPGKAYEYLAAGGHTLAIAEEGATADLIGLFPGSAVCDAADLEGMKRLLGRWYGEFKGDHRPHALPRAWEVDVLRPYEWRDLGRRYARLLDEFPSEVEASCRVRTSP